jgi:HAD superfamily phosphoserine phosphatase-like hydrolase
LYSILLSSPWLFAWKLKLCSASKAKEKLFCCLYKGLPYDLFKCYGKSFVHDINRRARKEILSFIQEHKRRGDKVYIVTASIDEWVRPWGVKQGVDGVLATRISVSYDGRIIGKFSGENCVGYEKVRRLLEVEPNRSDYYLTVYGDSCGDEAIMSIADKSCFIGKDGKVR